MGILTHPNATDKAPPCVSAGYDLFDSMDWSTHLHARAVCATCPLVAECIGLAVAISKENQGHAYRQPFGTWGGMLWRRGEIVTKKPAEGAA